MTTSSDCDILPASGVDFSPARWDRVREAHRRWWNRELGRPLIQIRIGGCASSRPKPELAFEGFTAAYGNTRAAAIVDSWDYNLSTQRFLGDSFPTVWLNYGPGVVAAFLGCQLHLGKRKETVWFHPGQVREITDVTFTPDQRESPHWRQMLQIARVAGEYWRGKVQVGLTDFGGTLDVLSSFRPSEALLYDLYDEPERVQELTWEIHRRWWDFYDRMDACLRTAGNPGTSCWTPLFCENRYYMLQCDFCYMLGPDMFEKFVLPELAASCRRLDRAFYHLDGVGELASLDLLLSIPELQGVQWIPGDGQPDITNWPEVYRKISDAGKLIQFFGHGTRGMRALDTLVQQTGRADNIVAILSASPEEQDEAEKFLARWNA